MARITRRSALLTVGAAGLVGATAAAEEPASTSFKTRLGNPRNVRTKVVDLGDLPGSNISPDGQAMTIAFDSLELGLDQGEELTATLIASLIIPVSTQEPTVENFRGYSAFVQGFVEKGTGARVVVTADIGESNNVVEFPYGSAVSDDFLRPIFWYPSVKERRESPNGGAALSRIAPAPHVPVILTLSIQRRSVQDQVLVVLDSLDLEIIDAVKVPTEGAKAPAEKKSPRRSYRERKGR